MRQGFRIAALVLLAGPFSGCDGAKNVIGAITNTVARAVLRGSQVVPARAAGPAGTATVTVHAARLHIDYTVDATGLSGAATAIEIRVGRPGENGPVLFTIPTGAFPVSGRFDSTTAFVPVGSIGTFADACEAIKDGSTYVRISTAA